MKSWQSCVSSDRNPLGKGRNAQPITRISGLPNCDLFDSLPYFKDDMASMEHPVFSLTTHIDKRLLRYEHNGNTLTIKPGYDGLPTIHDKDILIYVASHLRAAMNEGRAPSRTVRFTAHDF